MYPILDTRVECKENGDFNGFDWMGNLNIIRLECKVALNRGTEYNRGWFE